MASFADVAKLTKSVVTVFSRENSIRRWAADRHDTSSLPCQTALT